MSKTKEKSTQVSTKDARYKRVQCYLEESNYVGLGKFTEFEWKDYSPEIFRNIQQHDNIKQADYTMLLCTKDVLREVFAPGKPGRVIIFSTNDRFAMKILRKSEVKVILNTLKTYYGHLQNYKSSPLLRLYGLHSARQLGGLKVYFVIFGNPIPFSSNIFGAYCLKGSSKGRKMRKLKVDEHIIHKDLDFDYCFYLNPLFREKLLMQIKIDCEFLEAEGIMGYCLLIGLAMQTSPYTGKGPIDTINSYTKKTSFSPSSSPADSSDSGTISSYCSLDFEDTQLNFADTRQDSDRSSTLEFRHGMGVPARAVRTKITENEGKQNESFNVLIFVGIVDFYQKYNMKKRIEHLYKSMQYDAKLISAIKPQDYSSRFQYFLENTFLPEDSEFDDFGSCNWEPVIIGQSL